MTGHDTFAARLAEITAALATARTAAAAAYAAWIALPPHSAGKSAAWLAQNKAHGKVRSLEQRAWIARRTDAAARDAALDRLAAWDAAHPAE